MIYQLGYLLGVMIGGALLGLIPFFTGRKKGQKELGILGLIICAVGALWNGVISVLVAIIFTIMISKKAKN